MSIQEILLKERKDFDMGEGKWNTKIGGDIKLPRKLWKLLSLSWHDMSLIKHDPYTDRENSNMKYIFNMSKFHQPHPEHDKCYVCMAGAVIAKTLRLSYNYTYGRKGDFSYNNYIGVKTIEYMRRKNYVRAYYTIHDLDYPYGNSIKRDIKDKLLHLTNLSYWEERYPQNGLQYIKNVALKLKEWDL